MIIAAKSKGLMPNTASDCTTMLNEIILNAQEGSTIQIEKGEYHLYEEKATKINYPLSNTDVTENKNISILLLQRKNLILDFNDSLLICHGRLQPLTLDGCENITVKNLRIDWEIPLSAEGTSLGGDETYTDFWIDPTLYPYEVKNERLIFKGESWEEPLWPWGHTSFDPITGHVPVNSGDNFQPHRVEQLENNVVRIYGQGSVPKDYITVLRHNPRVHAGIFTVNSCDITYSNIYIHNTGGLGMLSQFNKNLTFKGIHFEANKERGRRVVCGHDDGLHLVNNRGHVLVEDCSFYGLMDDAINIHGISVQVSEILDEHTLRCSFMHNQAKGFPEWAVEGQEISFIEHMSMASMGIGIVDSFILETPDQFMIQFKQTIPEALVVGDALENISNTASFVCRNNYFGSGRARGILISVPQPVLIEHNVFETAGCAILLAGDANQWFESGACHDVHIKNNVFSSACLCAMYQFCEAIISICPEIPKPKVDRPFHENIRIENNVFHPFDYPVLYAFSVRDLSFKNNTIIRSTTYKPWHKRKHMITLNSCEHVTVVSNRLIGDVLGQDILLQTTSKQSVETDLRVVGE